MANKKLVIGMFESEAAAGAAVDALKAWDRLDDDVKLHHITVMTVDDEGKLKVSNLLKTRAAGAAEGFGVGLLAVILAGPIGPVLAVPTLTGALGAAGVFYRQDLGLDRAGREVVAAELGNGKAAVGLLVKHEEEAVAVAAKLAELGGAPDTHEVTEEVEAAAEQAARAAGG